MKMYFCVICSATFKTLLARTARKYKTLISRYILGSLLREWYIVKYMVKSSIVLQLLFLCSTFRLIGRLSFGTYQD